MTKFIALASGKGGTGKTTIAVNLAIALNSLGRDTTVFDANLVAPNIGLHLGFPELETTLHSALEGKSSIEEALYLHPSGLKVVPGSVSFKKREFKKKLSDILLGLIGKTEIVIIDAGSDASALEAADETIVVTTPDHPSLTGALKTIQSAEDAGSVVIGIILNKAKKADIKAAKSILKQPIIAAVPEDKKISRSIAARQPVTISYPHSAASREFRKLADLLNQ